MAAMCALLAWAALLVAPADAQLVFTNPSYTFQPVRRNDRLYIGQVRATDGPNDLHMGATISYRIVDGATT